MRAFTDPALDVWLAVAVAGILVFIDLRGWQRFLRRHRQLLHEGRLQEAEAFLRRERRKVRLFVRPLMAIGFPGGLEIFSAQVYHQMGRLEEGLDMARKGALRARSHPKLLGDALNLQVLCLADLGHYDDARGLAARSRSLGRTEGADVADARTLLVQGRLDEASECGLRAAVHPRGHLGRVIASQALHCKGESRAALELLLDRPPDVRVHYAEESLRRIERSGSARSLLELHQKLWAGIVEPLRFLNAAIIYSDLGDLPALRFSLDQAAGTMGGHPGLRSMHRMLEASLFAQEGDGPAAERCLQEGREILAGPTTRGQKADFLRWAGRTLTRLGRWDAAQAELDAAMAIAIHPLEKHTTRFWMARLCEARGAGEKAAELYRSVAADGIPSRYAAEAAKASRP